MGKLQPNFSWQTYEGEPQDQREQFQYQLQTQHIQVANSVNTTIDDESFFSRERMTAFTWTDGKAIWKKTISGLIVATASPLTTSYPHGISGINKFVRLEATAQNASPLGTGIPLPYVNAIVSAVNVGIYIDATNLNITTTSAAFNGYMFSATIYFTRG